MMFILIVQLQKHMLSDKKWYDWLTGQVAVVGSCYGLALELQEVPSKTANNCNILNHRLGNDYKLLYRITYDYQW